MDTLDGSQLLQKAIERLNINLAQLVAETSLWVHPLVFQAVKNDNGLGVWYPNIQREKKGRRVAEINPDITYDNNSYANNALKQALGLPYRSAKNFHVCHVWEDTCYDSRYHTCVANLVLVPKAISSLTDYDALTIAALHFRAFELYSWYPEGERTPEKPVGYPDTWKTPDLPVQNIEAMLKRRRAKTVSAFLGGGALAEPVEQNPM